MWIACLKASNREVPTDLRLFVDGILSKKDRDYFEKILSEDFQTVIVRNLIKRDKITARRRKGRDFVGPPSYQESYSACSASVYCDSFPGTTVYRSKQGDTALLFYNESPSVLSVDGEYDTTLIIYSNYKDVFRYPFTYNTTYVDTFSATYTKGGLSYDRYGAITVTGDAYGTLVSTFFDTFSNAIRVHRVENYFDSSAGLGIVYSYFVESYSWYIPGYRQEFAKKISKSINGVYVPSIYIANTQRRFATSVLGVNNPTIRAELYPNPATTQLTISASSAINELTITNIIGQTIYSHQYNATKVELDVMALPPGVYFVKVNDEVRKFIKA